MSELNLAMLAGARAIENNKRYQGATFVHDVFGDNPQEISYCEAARLLREEANRAQPANEPLTLDELRERVNICNPVYVCHTDFSPMFREQVYCGAVLDRIAGFGEMVQHIQAIYGRNLTLAEEDYGKTWLAYRRKPERSENV